MLLHLLERAKQKDRPIALSIPGPRLVAGVPFPWRDSRGRGEMSTCRAGAGDTLGEPGASPPEGAQACYQGPGGPISGSGVNSRTCLLTTSQQVQSNPARVGPHEALQSRAAPVFSQHAPLGHSVRGPEPCSPPLVSPHSPSASFPSQAASLGAQWLWSSGPGQTQRPGSSRPLGRKMGAGGDRSPGFWLQEVHLSEAPLLPGTGVRASCLGSLSSMHREPSHQSCPLLG